MDERLGAAVDYLEARLGAHADLDEAARRAGFSRWHFMRVFQAAAGLPVAEYVRRRRLSRAAEALAAGRPVLEVALAWGYESQAAFTRAFSLAFAVPPATFARCARAGGPPLDLLLRFEPRLPFPVEPPPPPRTETRLAFRAVGLGTRAETRRFQAFTDIPAFWQDWLGHDRGRALRGVPGGPTYGLMRVLASGEVEYLIALETDADAPVPRAYRAVQVAGGKYAVFSAEGPPSRTIQRLALAAYTRWLPGAGVRRRPGAWDLEVYHDVPGLSPGSLRCELWLPIPG
jgi:AraC family transcriptional regulator